MMTPAELAAIREALESPEWQMETDLPVYDAAVNLLAHIDALERQLHDLDEDTDAKLSKLRAEVERLTDRTVSQHNRIAFLLGLIRDGIAVMKRYAGVGPDRLVDEWIERAEKI